MSEKLRTIAALAGYAASIGGVFVFLAKIWRGIRAERDGVLCLLRSSIRRLYYAHADESDPALREYERKDLDDLYAGYHILRGNHFIDDLYEKMRRWKVVT